MKRFWIGVCAAIIVSFLASCSGARILMQQAPKKPHPYSELPTLMTLDKTKANLEEEIFGPIPVLSQVDILSKKIITRNSFTDGDIISEWKISAGYGAASKTFHVVLIMKDKQGNAPFIITQNFCPNPDVVPVNGITPPEGITFSCAGDGMIAQIFGYFFGRYIKEHPYQIILDRGYNIAVFYPTEFLPDSRELAPSGIESLLGVKSHDTYGALAIWASLSNWLAAELKATFKNENVVVYGHSRYGKTALLSAAYSQDIDGVIAHQSGTGGASILRDGKGESVASITKSYPHWFTPNFKTFASREQNLSVDSHHLLSLIAPRPILLGNARRDVWSDPVGAFNAAKAASESWRDLGLEGLTTKRLDDFIPEDNIAFWMRPGTHGVVEEDWPAFLAFMDAHFK